MAVLLSVVLVAGMVSQAAPLNVFAKEGAGMPGSVSENTVNPPEKEIETKPDGAGTEIIGTQTKSVTETVESDSEDMLIIGDGAETLTTQLVTAARDSGYTFRNIYQVQVYGYRNDYPFPEENLPEVKVKEMDGNREIVAEYEKSTMNDEYGQRMTYSYRVEVPRGIYDMYVGERRIMGLYLI